MPAASNITINDGAATPVAHTFTPIGKDDKGVLWFEQTNPVPASPLEAKRIGYRQYRSTSGGTNGVSKMVLTVALPTLETLGNNSAGFTPPPTLAYRNAVRIEFDLPERGTKQQRKDLRTFVYNLLGAGTLPTGAIDDLLPIY